MQEMLLKDRSKIRTERIRGVKTQ